MKRIFLAVMMALTFGITAQAQSYTRQGNTFTQVAKSSSKSEGKKTRHTYETSKGDKYPIYLSKNGRAYIIRTSQKSGNDYKQYLGEEISRQICKEMGVTYVEKK